MHRAAVESICGLQVEGERARLRPRLPSHWPVLTLTLKRQGREHVFTVCAAWAGAEIGRARAEGALELDEGAWLALPQAGTASRHLVVCAPRALSAPRQDPATADRIRA
jgi:cyclic beta-1,2-glucan synthetase